MSEDPCRPLEGTVALITGAARGQGRAHAVRLARAGAGIVGLDIGHDIDAAPYPLARQEDLSETQALVEAQGGTMEAVVGDVRSQDDLDHAVRVALGTFGRLDHVIANAGFWGVGRFWELTESQWTTMQDVNLSGVWRTCKAAAPHLIAQRRGAIVITASVSGFEPGNGSAHYTASKHGLIGLMKNIALELGPYRIRCNAICPSTADTPMSNWQGAYDLVAGHPGGTREEYVTNSRQWHALRDQPALSPDAMAEAALWLLSESAMAITGIALPVDGGHLLLPGIKFWTD
jgi:SDR family mycofactocin-dependent oxidoreductase